METENGVVVREMIEVTEYPDGGATRDVAAAFAHWEEQRAQVIALVRRAAAVVQGLREENRGLRLLLQNAQAENEVLRVGVDAMTQGREELEAALAALDGELAARDEDEALHPLTRIILRHCPDVLAPKRAEEDASVA